ncbi:MAG: Uma2 family endonuclease [Planctomycetes bacterium]|nr:Uma2 family endonuclease [Planctomycetota bacterium]
MPDVAFVRAERFPDGRVPRVPIGDVPIDLAVEILSPGNTSGEIEEKCREYFSSGTQIMWVADPTTRTVQVYKSAEEYRDFSVADTLDGGSVLPEFQISVQRWFEEAETI